MESGNDFQKYRDRFKSDEKMQPNEELKSEEADNQTGIRILTPLASDDMPLYSIKGDHIGKVEGLSLGCCKLHDEQRKQFFCRDCQIFMCASCVLLEHGKASHTWTSASDAAGQIQEEVGEILLKAEMKLENVSVGISELQKKFEKVPLQMQALREDVTKACDDAMKHFTQYLQTKRLLLLERINILEKSGISDLEDSRKKGQEIQAKLARITKSGLNVNATGKLGDILERKSNLEESLKVIPVQKWCKQSVHVKVGALDPELRFIKGTQGTLSQRCWCHVGTLVHPGRWQLVRTVKVDRQLGDLVTAIAAIADGSVAVGYQMNGVYIIDSAGNQRHIHQGVGHVKDIALIKGHKLAVLDANGIIKVVQLLGHRTVSDQDAQDFHNIRCLSASEEGVVFAGPVSENSIYVLGADGSKREIVSTGITPLRIAVSTNHIAALHHPASITIMDMAGQAKCTIHEDQWAYASLCSSGMGDFFVLSANKANPKSLKIGRYAIDGTMVETVVNNYHISALGWLNPRMSASSGKLMVCIEDELITFEREMLTLE